MLRDWDLGLASSPDGCLMATRPTAPSPGPLRMPAPAGSGLGGLGGERLGHLAEGIGLNQPRPPWLTLRKGTFLGRGQGETPLRTGWVHLRFRFGGQPLPEAPSGSDSLFSGRRAHQCRPYVLPRSSPHLRGLRDCFGRGSPVAGPGPPDSCGGAAVSQLQEWICSFHNLCPNVILVSLCWEDSVPC